MISYIIPYSGMIFMLQKVMSVMLHPPTPVGAAPVTSREVSPERFLLLFPRLCSWLFPWAPHLNCPTLGSGAQALRKYLDASAPCPQHPSSLASPPSASFHCPNCPHASSCLLWGRCFSSLQCVPKPPHRSHRPHPGHSALGPSPTPPPRSTCPWVPSSVLTAAGAPPTPSHRPHGLPPTSMVWVWVFVRCVGVWVCGCVGVWVCGCVGAWVRGCVGVDACVCVDVRVRAWVRLEEAARGLQTPNLLRPHRSHHPTAFPASIVPSVLTALSALALLWRNYYSRGL